MVKTSSIKYIYDYCHISRHGQIEYLEASPNMRNLVWEIIPCKVARYHELTQVAWLCGLAAANDSATVVGYDEREPSSSVIGFKTSLVN
jgi:hypothetical protein